MVIQWNDYEIYLTPRYDILATKWMTDGRYQSWHCLDGHWNGEPPHDLRDWYEKRIMGIGMVAVGD